MERTKRAWALVLVALAASACGSTAADDSATGAEQNLDPCKPGSGQVTGWDCAKSGQVCKPKCFATTQASHAYVAFEVDGKTLDSRDVPYDPVESLDHVLLYGCTLWDVDEGVQGLDFEYKRFVGAAPSPDRRTEFQDYVDISIGSFRGPGSYAAVATYIASDAAQAAGIVYHESEGCGVEVGLGSGAVLKGTITCTSLTAKDGTKTPLTGEFACGGSALSPNFSRLPGT